MVLTKFKYALEFNTSLKLVLYPMVQNNLNIF